jgi:hypothetical protein
MEPAVALSNCKMALDSVDLPQPDSPTRPNVSPLYNLKDTLLTALKASGFENQPDFERNSFSRLITSKSGFLEYILLWISARSSGVTTSDL